MPGIVHKVAKGLARRQGHPGLPGSLAEKMVNGVHSECPGGHWQRGSRALRALQGPSQAERAQEAQGDCSRQGASWAK